MACALNQGIKKAPPALGSVETNYSISYDDRLTGVLIILSAMQMLFYACRTKLFDGENGGAEFWEETKLWSDCHRVL
jgi:hypothetical protein